MPAGSVCLFRVAIAPGFSSCLQLRLKRIFNSRDVSLLAHIDVHQRRMSSFFFFEPTAEALELNEEVNRTQYVGGS
jgi:hypothetical protein